jgi:GT2 family glycosyltransferase
MIYIILPVHNRKKVTELFIKALLPQTYNEFKLILVDDDSTDDTDKMVLSYLPDSVILKGDGNLWWSGGLQKGYEWVIENGLDEDICLLINDDTTFDENFLKIGYGIIHDNKKTLLSAKSYSSASKKSLGTGVKFNFKDLTFARATKTTEINCLSTRGLFLRISDFKDIGGFYPKALPHYLSDYEFTIRANNLGFRLVVNDKLKLFVDEETTGLHTIKGEGIVDYWRKYFSYRNSSNPFHWIVFIWLVVPWKYKVNHILRQVYRTGKAIISPIVR